jgi:iron(III) transport system permease protein
MTLTNFVHSPWSLAWAGTSHTLELMVCVPIAAVALGLIASWVIVKSRSRFRGVIDLLLFLPHAVPGIVFAIALLTLALFVISRFLPLAGTVLIIGIAYLLVFVSFAVRSRSVAVVQVSNDLEEAAYVGGLSVGRTMTSAFLPLVSQAALNAWVWIALLVGRELTIAVVLFTSANITLPAVIWSTWFTGELGESSAMSLVFMVIFLPVVLVYLLQRVNRRRPETTALVG